MIVEDVLRVTFLGAGILCLSGAIHVYEHGYWEFWRYPVSPAVRSLMRMGGVVMFAGAAATLVTAALE